MRLLYAQSPFFLRQLKAALIPETLNDRTIQHPDLAEALRGDSGTFFCQQGGQGYIVTAAEGFSIKSLRPVGRKIVEANVLMQTTPEPWAITKISEDVLEFSAIPQQSPRQQRAA